MLKLTSLLCVTLAILGSSTATQIDEINEEKVQKFRDEIITGILAYNDQKSSGAKISDFLPPEFESVMGPYLKKRFNGSMKIMPKDLIDLFVCTGCEAAIDGLLLLFQTGISYEALFEAAVTLCSPVMGEPVCRGAIQNYFPELWYIIHERGSEFTGGSFCALTIGGQCADWEAVNNWAIPVPDNKPEVITPTLPAEGSPVIKVLHLTDIHLDLSYKVGTVVDCGLPLCCSNTTQLAPSGEEGAGHWGNYYCDTPLWMLEDMLLQIKEKHHDEIDYILLTGDHPAHDVWLQSRSANLEHIQASVTALKNVFPDKPILPILGNHDTFPCNSFPPHDVPAEEFKPDWLYSNLRTMYADWLPEEALETLGKYGYYTFLLQPGFRIISMNSMMCYTLNFWLNYNQVDPMNSLAWLIDQLSAAEANGEIVHILNHIPPGNPDCHGAWGKEFSKIVNRFENIIRAQFYGHTHNDEFVLFYDTETNTRPSNIGFLTPSVTTYKGLNPSYRIFTIDGMYEGTSWRVLDHDTYIFNLDTANALYPDRRPDYFKYYSAKKDLEMPSLFPEDYDNLIKRMATDDEFYAKYFRYYNSDSWGDFDHDRRNVVCGMVATSSIDFRKCEELLGPEK